MIQRFNRSFILLGAIIACFAAIQTVALAQEMNQCDVLVNEDGVPIDEEGFVSTVILGTDDINDILQGMSTDDTITGGDGFDLHRFTAGQDVITDFHPAKDMIDVGEFARPSDGFGSLQSLADIAALSTQTIIDGQPALVIDVDGPLGDSTTSMLGITMDDLNTDNVFFGLEGSSNPPQLVTWASAQCVTMDTGCTFTIAGHEVAGTSGQAPANPPAPCSPGDGDEDEPIERELTSGKSIDSSNTVTLAPSGDVFNFGNAVILATIGDIFIHKEVQIISGNVITNSFGGEIDIAKEVTTSSDVNLAADEIDVRRNSTVGDVYFNFLDLGINVVTGSQNTPLALPVIDPAEFPDFQAATPGTDDIIVGRNKTVTITPGSFDDVIVKRGGTLILDAEGIYNFDNVVLFVGANLLYDDPVDVRIDDNITALWRSTIGATNSSIDASDAVFYFGGSSGFNLAFFGTNTDINGTFYGADYSRIRIGWKAKATGSFVASDIIVGKKALITFDGFFANAAPTITSPATASVPENQTGVIDVEATDDIDSEGSGLTYNLTGGADQALFNIDANTGVVTFINAPDFENPADAGADNNYNIQVTVTDSGPGTPLTDVQDIVITVTDEAENTAPTITSAATASVPENQTSAIDVNSTDDSDSEGSGLTYSLSGGADAGLFSIDAGTGMVTFNSAPDFEAAGDANGDNDYEIQVTVTDSGGLTDVQDIVITVTDEAENTAPTITSAATASVPENQTSAIDVNSTDDSDSEGSGLTYSLSGGADAGLFSIDAGTGMVTFNSAPDFEAAGDANGDNDYEIQVTVTDSGGLIDVQDIVITVTDVVEVPAPDAVDDAFDVTGNVGINVGSAGSILNNDLGGAPTALFFGDSAGTANGTAANGTNTITTSNGGTVLLNADGTFTYDSAAGFDGIDSFFYSSSNSGGSDVAEVTFNVGDVIWFIDNSAVGSTQEGTLANPFTALADFTDNNNGVDNNPEADDNIFLYSGSGNYTGGVTLLDDQTLIGQGATGASLESLLGITLAPFSNTLPTIGGTDPVIVNSGGNGITLASGNTIRGLNIGSASIDGISGTNVSDVAISEVNISNTGIHGIDLSSVTNFTYEDSEIVGAGNSDDENSIHIRNLFGTSLIEDVRLDDINEHGIDVRNSTTDDGTTDTLTIRRLSVEDHTGAGFGESGILAESQGTSNLTLNVEDSTFTLNNNGALGVLVNSLGTSTLDLTIDNNTFNALNAFGSGAIQVINEANSNATVAVTNNDINESEFISIVVNNDDNATSAVTISGNDIDADSTAAGVTDFGIQVRQDENGEMTVLIDNNTLDGIGDVAIFGQARDTTDGTGTLNITVTNNANGLPVFGQAPGLVVRADDTNTVNANIFGNNFLGNDSDFPGFIPDIVLRNDATFNLTQTSEANLSAVNNGDSVGVFGANPINFGASAPPLP